VQAVLGLVEDDAGAGLEDLVGTSRPEVMPVCSIISRPTTVFMSWNAGRQCMNLTAGLPDWRSRAALTWYGVRRWTRSSQTSLDSPIDTHTSVWMKSAPRTRGFQKLLDPGANHPQKGDDTPGRFEKAELGGGSYGTGHTGAAGVTQ
jgi:hypothetical protein